MKICYLLSGDNMKDRETSKIIQLKILGVSVLGTIIFLGLLNIVVMIIKLNIKFIDVIPLISSICLLLVLSVVFCIFLIKKYNKILKEEKGNNKE